MSPTAPRGADVVHRLIPLFIRSCIVLSSLGQKMPCEQDFCGARWNRTIGLSIIRETVTRFTTSHNARIYPLTWSFVILQSASARLVRHHSCQPSRRNRGAAVPVPTIQPTLKTASFLGEPSDCPRAFCRRRYDDIAAVILRPRTGDVRHPEARGYTSRSLNIPGYAAVRRCSPGGSITAQKDEPQGVVVRTARQGCRRDPR